MIISKPLPFQPGLRSLVTVLGWASASEGRVISNFFYKLGRVKPVLFATGDGHSFFWQGKNYSMSLT